MSVPLVVPDASVLLKWVLPSEKKPAHGQRLVAASSDSRLDRARNDSEAIDLRNGQHGGASPY